MTDTRRKRPSRDERPPQSTSLDSLPPPPPYKEAATPPLLSMTEVMTTTEVITTTQTTTHFFSLPLWRKRGVHPVGNANGGVPSVDENGVMRRPLTTLGVPFVDKALPPTPHDDPYPRTSTPSRLPNRSSDTLHPSHDDHTRRSRPSSPVQRPSTEPRRSTAALVHAALGIGLPAVLPQMAGPSSLNPESITAPAPTDRIASDGLRGSVRRAKSTRALAKKRAAPDPVYSSDGETSPRTRKNSFATSIFTSTPGAKGKGKARANVDVEVDEPDTIHPVKSLSRRPSFWSRKKSLPAPVQTVAPPTNAHDLDTSPTLPSLPPLSPFLMNSRMTASPEPQDGFGDSRASTPPHGRRRRSISLTPPMLNNTYIDQFDFTSDPLDVALRKLLMDVGLPRETQQIDRVIEAFATRYKQCNPNLYTSEDHPYILAFSLIMLHTDAFNKSNKRKMTKADYIKNTRLPGVASEVLDCFYDNIVFAPFIFIEDPLDINGQRGLVSDSANRLSSASSLVAASTPISKSNKVDPYFLIINGLLDPLRVNVEAAHKELGTRKSFVRT
ncbi:hypothetical protein ONZ45_g18682 [Pleurotus djamor]|nr:hypothetical protein ONZ45_g18682 [Pleurotus djamor]